MIGVDNEPQTAQERMEQLQELMTEFQKQRAVLESEIWEYFKYMMTWRRNLLVEAVLNTDEEGARPVRTKGRINEIDYWLGHMERLERGEAEARKEMDELERLIVEQRVYEDADRLGVER